MTHYGQRAGLLTGIALSGISMDDLYWGCIGYGSELVDQAEFAAAVSDPEWLSDFEVRIAGVVVNERLIDLGLPRMA